MLLSENSHESDCPTSSHLLDGLAVKPSQDEKARVMHTLDYFLDLLIEPFLSCSHRSTQQTLTCSNKSIISIVRCADVTVKRAKIPLAGSIWKRNAYGTRIFRLDDDDDDQQTDTREHPLFIAAKKKRRRSTRKKNTSTKARKNNMR